MILSTSDPGPSGPPADHGGQRLGAGGLEVQRLCSKGLLAHLGGAAKLHLRPALLPLPAGRLSVNAADQHPSVGQSVRVAHLQDGAGRRALLHGAVSHR